MLGVNRDEGEGVSMYRGSRQKPQQQEREHGSIEENCRERLDCGFGNEGEEGALVI